MNKQILKEILQDKNDKFILFYSEDCIHCSITKPIIQEHAAKKMIPVHRIEETTNNGDIFDMFKVDFYPTLIHIKDGRALKYVGVDPIVEMIKSQK
jgi:hypothetical protein